MGGNPPDVAAARSRRAGRIVRATDRCTLRRFYLFQHTKMSACRGGARPRLNLRHAARTPYRIARRELRLDANTDRDIDFYHWSSQSFGDFWKDALSVLMARERARIGLAASKGDWPRRIAAYARDEQEDAAAYADS